MSDIDDALHTLITAPETLTSQQVELLNPPCQVHSAARIPAIRGAR